MRSIVGALIMVVASLATNLTVHAEKSQKRPPEVVALQASPKYGPALEAARKALGKEPVVKDVDVVRTDKDLFANVHFEGGGSIVGCVSVGADKKIAITCAYYKPAESLP